jgi:hypothetical protein
MKGQDRLDWDRLVEVWADEHVDDDLLVRFKRRIRRHTLVMRLSQVVEFSVLVGLAWISRWYLGDSPTSIQITIIATAWGWAAALEAFALWNRRGNWKADSIGVGGCVTLLERRAAARLRTARAVGPLVLVQGVIVLALLAVAGGARSQALTIGLGSSLLAVIVTLVLVWARRYGRDARADLVELAETRRLLAGDLHDANAAGFDQ